MHTNHRHVLRALLALAAIVTRPASAVEPAAPLPDSLWTDPLFSGAPAATAGEVDPEDLRFLPPIVVDAAAAARIAPASGGARRAAAPAAGAAEPYVAAGRPADVRAPAVNLPEGVLPGPGMTLNPEGEARVTVIPELATAPNFGTAVRGGGVSVQGGSSRVGVGVGVSRDATGRTSGGLGVTLTFP
jgi:hypothetical protein